MSFVNSVKEYLNNNPSTTDAELRNYVKSLENTQNTQNTQNTHTQKSRHSSVHQLELFSPFSSFVNNSLSFFDRFEQMSKLMDSNFDDFNLTEFEDVKPEPTDRGYSRSKTSYVSYHNGEKKKKTVEVSQRYDDKGVMKMHKRKTVEDSNGKTVEEYFPDGTKNVSKYSQNALENK